MSKYTTNEEIIARWQGKPAPFLGILHDFLARDGIINDKAMGAVGTVVGKSPGALGVLLSSYPVFPRIEGLRPSPPPLKEVVLPPPNPDQREECLFRSIRVPEQKRLAVYRRSGGYQALTNVVASEGASALLDRLDRSGLTGGGGGCFSTGQKWRAVAEAPGPNKTVICNGDEGEPGLAKDRVLLELDPHSVIEGMALAAYVTGAKLGIIYLRNDFVDAREILDVAIEEATTAGLLGERILDADFSFEIHIRMGTGTYMSGEETVLINTLEGNYPLPRNRPPYPSTRGFKDEPTLVNNVETLVTAAKIAAHGASWYQKLGLGDNAGTKIVSLSGDIQNPGNYEIPRGLPLGDLIFHWAGGVPKGRSLQAMALAGASGGIVGEQVLKCTLDDALVNKGTLLGAGGIIVYDDTRDVVRLAQEQIRFFEREMCGKCDPCELGLAQLGALFDFKKQLSSFEVWCANVKAISEQMTQESLCGLGKSAAYTPLTMLRYFAPQLEQRFTQQG
ncbi:MAG: hypothetical protein GY847_16295 [Proteobacteria bacterium]|nr:hypothetical protein [Pseudomonadota bacterium]